MNNKINDFYKDKRRKIYQYLRKSRFSIFIEKTVENYCYYKNLLLSPFVKSDIILSDRKSARKVLYLTHYYPNGILTVKQTIQEYVELSEYSVDVLNVYPMMPLINKRRLKQYDCLLVHNSVLYSLARMKLVGKLFLNRFDGLKVIMKQDEHYHTSYFAKYLKRYNIDLLLSIWDVNTAAKIYHLTECPNLHIMQFLTGYVPESYRFLEYDLSNRKIDIGYRGSEQPLLFGRLAYEKKEIGDKFLCYAEKYGLIADISSQNSLRYTGMGWLDFLGNCKATLAVESGSDIVDLDGNVTKQYEKYCRKHPKAGKEEILSFMQQYEEKIHYRAISPRHFEAAACKTLQIMYEGEYQGIFKPYRHYVPLKRDFSNIDEVVQILKDEEKRKAIVGCAFNEIIMNDEYSFSYFVRKLDHEIETIFTEKEVNKR